MPSAVSEPHPEMTTVSGDGTNQYGITGFYDNLLDDKPVQTAFYGILVVNQEGELRGCITDFWGDARLIGTFDRKKGLISFVKKYGRWIQESEPPAWYYELQDKLGDDHFEGTYRHRGKVGGEKSVVCTIFHLFPARDKTTVLW